MSQSFHTQPKADGIVVLSWGPRELQRDATRNTLEPCDPVIVAQAHAEAMLGRLHLDAPGESTYDRSDYRKGAHRRSRHDRRYKAKARRSLRRLEKRELGI